MTHKMKLNPHPFESVKSGRKTIEMRLFDEKRSAIRQGDIIEFTETDSGEKITCTVLNIFRYADFEELYRNHDKISIGYSEDENADPNDMKKYYPEEKIKKYGTAAIEIALINE